MTSVAASGDPFVSSVFGRVYEECESRLHSGDFDTTNLQQDAVTALLPYVRVTIFKGLLVSKDLRCGLLLGDGKILMAYQCSDESIVVFRALMEIKDMIYEADLTSKECEDLEQQLVWQDDDEVSTGETAVSSIKRAIQCLCQNIMEEPSIVTQFQEIANLLLALDPTTKGQKANGAPITRDLKDVTEEDLVAQAIAESLKDLPASGELPDVASLSTDDLWAQESLSLSAHMCLPCVCHLATVLGRLDETTGTQCTSSASVCHCSALPCTGCMILISSLPDLQEGFAHRMLEVGEYCLQQGLITKQQCEQRASCLRYGLPAITALEAALHAEGEGCIALHPSGIQMQRADCPREGLLLFDMILKVKDQLARAQLTEEQILQVRRMVLGVDSKTQILKNQVSTGFKQGLRRFGKQKMTSTEVEMEKIASAVQCIAVGISQLPAFLATFERLPELMVALQ